MNRILDGHTFYQVKPMYFEKIYPSQPWTNKQKTSKPWTNKLEKEVYMQKISRNMYKLMKICINTGKYKKI